MFIGEYYCNLDSKGRLVMPAKFRDILKDNTFYISKGIEGQIDLHTEESWLTIKAKLENVPQSNKKAMLIKRFILGSSQELSLDSQGRITITASLKEYANITKKMTIVGMDNKIEIWSSEKYNEEMNIDNMQELLEEANFDF